MASGDFKWHLAFLLPFAVLTGCASTPRLGGDPNLKVYPSSELPIPGRLDLTAETHNFYVGPFDKLSINVLGMPELSANEVQIDASGHISFPMAGSLKISGKTPEEIEEILAAALRANFIRDPHVTVNLTETVSQVVTVEGQVNKPGLYPISGRTSLLRSMALAGGTTEFSKLNDVVIFRTVEGQRLAALYDLNKIRHGELGDPEVFANDVVMVGDSKARRLFKDFLAVSPIITGPLIIALDRVTN